MKTFENFNKEPIPSFIFSFAIETGDDEYKSVIGIIPFLSEPEYEEDDRSDMDEKIIDACAEHNLESEPYGVHDVSGGQIEEVDGVEYEAIFGFDTYEVEEDKIQELMNIWKNIFDNELGFTTGNVIIVEITD